MANQIVASNGNLTITWTFANLERTQMKFDFNWLAISFVVAGAETARLPAFLYSETLLNPTAASIAVMTSAALAARRHHESPALTSFHADTTIRDSLVTNLIAGGLVVVSSTVEGSFS